MHARPPAALPRPPPARPPPARRLAAAARPPPARRLPAAVPAHSARVAAAPSAAAASVPPLLLPEQVTRVDKGQSVLRNAKILHKIQGTFVKRIRSESDQPRIKFILTKNAACCGVFCYISSLTHACSPCRIKFVPWARSLPPGVCRASRCRGTRRPAAARRLPARLDAVACSVAVQEAVLFGEADVADEAVAKHFSTKMLRRNLRRNMSRRR